MRIYLDNCVFNRLFDDQNHIRVRLETEAKLYIQSRIKNGDLQLVFIVPTLPRGNAAFTSPEVRYLRRWSVAGGIPTQSVIAIKLAAHHDVGTGFSPRLDTHRGLKARSYGA